MAWRRKGRRWIGNGKRRGGGRREGDSGCRIGVVFGQFILFPPFIRSLISFIRSLISANFILMKNEIFAQTVLFIFIKFKVEH